MTPEEKQEEKKQLFWQRFQDVFDEVKQKEETEVLAQAKELEEENLDEEEEIQDDEEEEIDNDSLGAYFKNWKHLVKKCKRRVKGMRRVRTTKGIKRIRSNLDMFCVIQGPEGAGKSHLANQFCVALDPFFSLKRNMIAIPDASEIQRMSDSLPKYSVIWLDEAITALYKRDFGSAGNKELIKFANICRKRNQYFILCAPRFYSLDKDIRDRVLLNIQIPSEQDSGIAIVNKRDDHPNLVGDRWHADITYDVTSGGTNAIKKKRYKRFDLLESIQEKINMLRKGPCFVMPIAYVYDEDMDKKYQVFVDEQKKEYAKKEAEEKELKMKKDTLGNYSEKVLRAQVQKAVALIAASGAFTNAKGVFDRELISKALCIEKATLTKMITASGVSPQRIKAAKLDHDIRTGDLYGIKQEDKTDLEVVINKKIEPELMKLMGETGTKHEDKVVVVEK